MNRSELVRAVAERAGSDEADARRHVDAVFETLMERVSAGERVTVTGFGTFDRLSRPSRTARNPRTGAPIEVAAAEVPRFRAGQTFRTRVAGAAPAEAEAGATAEPLQDTVDDAAAVLPSPGETPKAAKGGKKAKKQAKKKTDPVGSAAAARAKDAENSKAAKNAKGGKKNGKKKQGKKSRVKAGK